VTCFHQEAQIFPFVSKPLWEILIQSAV
jgi:hypothetical protein